MGLSERWDVGLVLDFEEAVTREGGDKYYNLGKPRQ
jgi:hypothetical protein